MAESAPFQWAQESHGCECGQRSQPQHVQNGGGACSSHRLRVHRCSGPRVPFHSVRGGALDNGTRGSVEGGHDQGLCDLDAHRIKPGETAVADRVVDGLRDAGA